MTRSVGQGGESDVNVNKVKVLAQILWDYHHVGHELKKADLIFALGSHDIRVARRSAELYQQGYAPLILFSGNEGVGREVSGFAGTPEAIMFKEEAIGMGVPEDNILTETEATNTGDNIKLSQKLLKEKGLEVESIIAVQKPYMERRTLATLLAQWPKPQPEFMVTSQQISLEDYVADPRYPKDYTINVMVGDLQRIIEYPKKGFQIQQDVPDTVLAAFNELVSLGYDKHLIKD